jgi:hypothetical protein
MERRHYGFLIVGIAMLIAFVVYAFNRALTTIVNTSCSHGTTCPMWGTIHFQTNIGIGIFVFVVLIGLYFIIFGDRKEKAALVKQKGIPKDLKGEEKKVYSAVVDAEGTIFQSDLAEKTGFNKVKVTRILDKLEGRQMIERKRRGMTNVVILK